MRKLALLLAALTAPVGFSTPASAQVISRPYVFEEFYLGQGGTPATPAEVAAQPFKILRSEVAYASLRSHMSSYLGYELTDDGFRSLMVSNRIKLVPCFGTLDTAGISDTGRQGWRNRSCYRGEMLIELTLDDGSRVEVASQGCYNPVRGRPVYPPISVRTEYWQILTPPPAAVQVEKDYSAKNPTSSTTRIDLPSMGSTVLVIGLGGFRHNDDCPPDQHEH